MYAFFCSYLLVFFFTLSLHKGNLLLTGCSKDEQFFSESAEYTIQKFVARSNPWGLLIIFTFRGDEASGWSMVAFKLSEADVIMEDEQTQRVFERLCFTVEIWVLFLLAPEEYVWFEPNHKWRICRWAEFLPPCSIETFRLMDMFAEENDSWFELSHWILFLDVFQIQFSVGRPSGFHVGVQKHSEAIDWWYWHAWYLPCGLNYRRWVLTLAEFAFGMPNTMTLQRCSTEKTHFRFVGPWITWMWGWEVMN